MLKLTDLRPELNFKVGDNLQICHLIDFVNGSKVLDYEVFLPQLGINLQRKFCWSFFKKQQLILSVLKGIPIPVFAMIKKEILSVVDGKNEANTVYEIIDGKQRLNALIGFCKDVFPIVWDDIEYYYSDLDQNAQRCLDGFTIRGFLASQTNFSESYKKAYPNHGILKDWEISDVDKIKWFTLINFAGEPHDLSHMKKLNKAISKIIKNNA